jgi:soluble lytic murein transglycosylase
MGVMRAGIEPRIRSREKAIKFHPIKGGKLQARERRRKALLYVWPVRNPMANLRRMHANRLVLLTVVLLAGTVLASAQENGVGPSVQPNPSEVASTPYRFLSAADHDLYTRAFTLSRQGNWQAALALAGQGQDQMGQRLLQWSYVLDRDSGASFSDIDAFLKNNPDWPSRETIFARAEKAIGPDMTPAAIVAWFGNRTPASSLGRVKLGEALIATGNTTKGREYIQKGWMEGTFELADELGIIERDSQYLSAEVDKQRLENLLWREDVTGAKRQITRVDADTQKQAQARIALKSGGTAAARAMDTISGDMADDPSLLFDRARAARRAGNNAQAQNLLRQIPARKLAAAHAARWWGELNVNARQALQDGDAKTAYALVNDTGLTSGTDFADAEFLAGWIALRYLKDPQSALIHFRKLDAGVSRPISKARARYWLGRAYEDLGDIPNAYAQYKLAAEVSDTFYGQIALARTEQAPVLRLADMQVDTTPARADFEKSELVRALRVLADLGQEGMLQTFATRVAQIYPLPSHQQLLMRTVLDMGYREIAVRLGKSASYDNMTMLTYTHPIISIPSYRGAGAAPENAVVLGLIRQETEFDPNAVSSAGARGIMQVMPETARTAARRAGLPFRPNDLISNPSYAIQIGMIEYGALLNGWNGSLILSLAAYNAGPGNARKWVAMNGDPRSPNVDPVDWIEAIPFTETRNYVQRVLENTQVYRNRLAGKDQPLRILADLYIPNTPGVMALNYRPPAQPGALAQQPAAKP